MLIVIHQAPAAKTDRQILPLGNGAESARRIRSIGCLLASNLVFLITLSTM